MTTQLKCPFCQQNNRCGVNKAAECWCMNTHIPAALLNLLDQAEIAKECVCAACIESFKQNPTDFAQKSASAK